MRGQTLMLGTGILALLTLNVVVLMTRIAGNTDPYLEQRSGLTITGTLSIINPAVPTDPVSPPRYSSTGTICAGEGPYADVKEGAEVTVLTGNGEVIATTLLSEGVRQGPQGAGIAALLVGCTFAFSVESIPRAERYAVSIGGRWSGGTYSFAELADTGGKISLSLGCTRSSAPSDVLQIEPPSRVYLTEAERQGRGPC